MSSASPSPQNSKKPLRRGVRKNVRAKGKAEQQVLQYSFLPKIPGVGPSLAAFLLSLVSFKLQPQVY